MRVVRVVRVGGIAHSDGGLIGRGVVVSTAYIADNEAFVDTQAQLAPRVHIAHIHHPRPRHRHRWCLVLKGFEGS